MDIRKNRYDASYFTDSDIAFALLKIWIEAIQNVKI